MSKESPEFCYLCGTQLCKPDLRPGESPPPNYRTRDHVPPSGLFPSPKPSNLIAIPCCFRCNNQHSGFDERLRFAASTPFDRNQVGQKIFEDAVLAGTLAKGRQMRFAASLLASMRTTEEHPDLVRVSVDTHEFQEGMIRMATGLLFALHP